MAISREEIREHFLSGVELNATHMLIVCDTFDYEDYPVYVFPGNDVKKVARDHHGPNMQKIMECYDLTLPMAEQLQEGLSWHGVTPGDL